MAYSKISVIGLGYIGLPTAAALSAHQCKVVGVDVNQCVVDTINRGEIHIIEPDLDGVVQTAVARGFLKATVTPEPADAFLIAVPTPVLPDHSPDISYIKSAALSIAPVLKKNNLVVLESTSPIGSTEQMAAWLAEARPDLTFPQTDGERSDIRIAYCPERVLPGHVLQELVRNDRIIGGMTPKCTEEAINLYSIFVQGACVATNARTAEMCKLTENSFRDVNIAFANELSMICDAVGVNVWELIDLANRHPRVKILQPGPGVGGHCIAVDPWFIVHSAPEIAHLIRTGREVNDHKAHYVVNRIKEKVAGHHEPIIACLGLAFKPDIDDLRESPAVEIVAELARKQVGRLLVVEPHVEKLPPQLAAVAGVELTTADDAIARASVVVMLVNHRVFREIAKDRLKNKTLIDTRGVWR